MNEQTEISNPLVDLMVDILFDLIVEQAANPTIDFN
jgi:hypothetical protein